MTIASCIHTSNYTIIGNACFNDQRLSFEALAIFTYLRSKPADWKVMQTELARRFKAGRDRVRNALKELVEYGYVRKIQSRVPKTGRLNAVDYVVLALPENRTAPESPPAEAQTMSENPPPEKPVPENRSLLSTDSLQNTDSTNHGKRTIPEEQNASGSSGLKSGDERSLARPLSSRDLPRPPYRQTRGEADHALRELQRMSFRTDWEDPDFALSARSERGSRVNWHKLLRSGHSAASIVNAAERLLSETPENQLPSLGGFLANYEDRIAHLTHGSASSSMLR